MTDISWETYLDNVPDIIATDIACVESDTGIQLPDDIRSLLAQHAGQVTEKASIAISDEGHRTVFGPVLVSANSKDPENHSYTVSFAIDALNEWGRAVRERKLFPFASNTAAGWFCVDMSDPAASKIVFVDTSYDPDEAGAISYVARDVPELLAKLQ